MEEARCSQKNWMLKKIAGLNHQFGVGLKREKEKRQGIFSPSWLH
jgi:hypothetical protein